MVRLLGCLTHQTQHHQAFQKRLGASLELFQQYFTRMSCYGSWTSNSRLVTTHDTKLVRRWSEWTANMVLALVLLLLLLLQSLHPQKYCH